MQRKAFTLIELLVVIAIIAILAAILFPVFAQAKLAAKKTAALSSVKQVGLAITMYMGDTDGEFPMAFQGTNWTGQDLWQQRVMPYTKSLGVFGVSADTRAGQTASVGAWAGVGVSFAANGYYGNWCCDPNWSSGFDLRGPMGVGNQVGNQGHGWLMSAELNETIITQPAATILLAEKHGDDIVAWNSAYNNNDFNFQGGNLSAFSMGGVLGGDHLDYSGWGPNQIPNGQQTLYKAHGTNPLMFEYGINGAVSASYSGQSTFVFVDGHAKSMIPASTNPDPSKSPQSNLWDGKR